MPNLIIGDVETTGLDEKKDHVLELALVAVDRRTFAVVATASWLVKPPLWPTVKRNIHEKVLEMHTRSGLIAELDAGGDSPEFVEADARTFIREHAPQTPMWHTPLGGCNPDFDRRFLRHRMPKLHAVFHYRNFDVRSITQLQDWVFGVQHVESPHRALPDALKAAADVRVFLGIDAATGGKNREMWGKA